MADSDPKGRGKRCLGTLYYSQARHDFSKDPVCVGFSRQLSKEQEVEYASLPKESVPAGDFKYVCMGYSQFERERRKEAVQKQSPTDPIELPYCEGLEVISAAELLKEPAVLNESTAGASVSGSDKPGARDPRHPNPVLPIPRAGRSYQPGLPGQTGDPTWDHFQERFLKVSRRIVERMGSNMAFMAKSAKEAVERLGGFRDD